jgi:hypothetical protein
MAEQIVSDSSVFFEVLKLVASGGLGAAIIGVIGKFWMGRKLEQERAQYREKLANLEAELAKKQTIHKLQFEKEFGIYEKLWVELVKLTDACALLDPGVELVHEDATFGHRAEEKAKAFWDSYKSVGELVKLQRPFYAEDVSQSINKLMSKAWMQAGCTILTKQKIEHNEELKTRVKEMRGIIEDIATSIRKRIGLIGSAELVE